MGGGVPHPEGRDGQGAAGDSVLGGVGAGKELFIVTRSSCWAGAHVCLVGLLPWYLP